MALTYDSFVNALFNSLAIASTGVPASPTGNSSATDPQWLLEVPRIVEYAEQRIYRELDLLNTRVDQVGTLSSGNRNFALPMPTGAVVVLEELSVVTPSSATATTGNWNVLTPVSRPMLDASWPANSTALASSIGGAFGQPQYYAMVNDQNVVVGPAPDVAYPIVVTGTVRPTPLSSGNQTTFLTTNLPDLFMAASMIRAALFARSLGAAQESEQDPATWENEYQRLLKSAEAEEARKMYRSAGWTAQQARPESTPQRQ